MVGPSVVPVLRTIFASSWIPPSRLDGNVPSSAATRRRACATLGARILMSSICWPSVASRLPFAAYSGGGRRKQVRGLSPGATTSERPPSTLLPRGVRRKCEAERAGFKPATHLSARTRFPVALLRPLGHLSALRSGEGGIRTLDGGIHPHNALAGRRLQPLGHFSAGARRIADPSPRNYPVRGRERGLGEHENERAGSPLIPPGI